MTDKNICIVPKLDGLGGPASFQRRLIPLLREYGCNVHHNLRDEHIDTILINGGTRDIVGLIKAKQRGIRIVHRLAQMNWVHRQRFSGLAFSYRSERNNILLAFIRRYLADALIYQSEFVQSMWENKYGEVPGQANIIYNGVDTALFTPGKTIQADQIPIKIAVVEGHLGEGNEVYLANAIHFGEAMAKSCRLPVLLSVAGDVPQVLKNKWQRCSALFSTDWLGVVSSDEIIDIQHGSHFMFSAELNGGCPNSVIEALACGTPVLGYATGALPELLKGNAGIAVPYGGNHWKLELADINGLVYASKTLLENLPDYQLAARKKAVQAYDIRRVSEQYLQVLINQE
ncbi:MAG: glycosyltransferase family 4 protein [Anaerolineaceae bacterium]|nr:glycosyltransferase family 4 protein [Anaerolineaceae bacterium]